jgi:hypothetical protein
MVEPRGFTHPRQIKGLNRQTPVKARIGAKGSFGTLANRKPEPPPRKANPANREAAGSAKEIDWRHSKYRNGAYSGIWLTRQVGSTSKEPTP